MLRRYILSFFIIISIASYSQKDTTVITILHINDLHAKINRFPQLKHVVDSIKEVNSEVYLMAAGDLFSGNPIVDRYEKRGWPIIDMMNDLHFDLSCLGNHDFDYGQKVLNERMADANFPFICANIKTDKAEVNQTKSIYILTTKSGIQIGIIGLLQVGQNGYPDSHPKNFTNIEFSDPAKVIKQYKKELNQYDMQIALTHLGEDADMELAKKNKWLDLIIGGHTHTRMEPARKVGKVTVTQAGGNVKNLGVATVKFLDKKLISIDDVLIPLKFQPRDSVFQDKVNAFSKNPELQKQIATLTYEIESPEEIGQMMADAYKEGLNADIAFQNIGGVRSKYIKEGPMKLIDIMFLDPFNNEIMLFDMNKKDLLSFLRYSFSVRHGRNQLISGIQASFMTNEKGELTDLILKDKEGNPLPEAKNYKVAINSYMASSYDFSVKEKAQYTGEFSNDLLIKYFTKYFPVQK